MRRICKFALKAVLAGAILALGAVIVATTSVMGPSTPHPRTTDEDDRP